MTWQRRTLPQGGSLAGLLGLPWRTDVRSLALPRAAAVGLANTATDWVLFVGMLQSGLFEGTQGVLFASALSYAVGICQSFLLSSRWVFARGEAINPKRVFSFFAVALLGLGITTVAVWTLPQLLPFGAPHSALALGLSRMSGIGGAFGTTYWLNKRLVFAERGIGPFDRLRWRTIGKVVAVSAVVAVAAFLRFFRLSETGQNLYYAAGVRSMLDSWHNFLFVSFDPGGWVMIDKPPLGLWLEVGTARLVGFHYWALAIPQAMAGTAAVLVLFLVLRSSYGFRIALGAAAILAVMPMSIASGRNNTFDTVTMLMTLLSAAALLRHVRTGRTRWLLLSAMWLGLGFNTKMWEAFLPLPAFAIFYLSNVVVPRRDALVRAAMFSAVLIVVSFSWVTFVGLTAPADRPTVYNGQGDSIWSLTFQYNGINRILGQKHQDRLRGPAEPNLLNEGAHTPTASPLRLLTGKLGTQIGWFLPLAALGIFAVVRGRRTRREANLLWISWLVVGAVYFSVAASALPQYLEAIAVPTAVLAALGLAEVIRLSRVRPWMAAAVVAIIAAHGTLLLFAAPDSSWPAIVALIAGSFVVAVIAIVYSFDWSASFRAKFAPLIAGAAVLVVFAGPVSWSLATSLQPASGSATRYPIAGPRDYRDYSPADGGDFPTALNAADPVLSFLMNETSSDSILVATERSLYGNAARYILVSNRPVLTFDVFQGDEASAASTLSALVQQGQLAVP